MNYKVNHEKQVELEMFTKRMFRKYHLKGWKLQFVNSKEINRGQKIISETLYISQRILFNSYSVVVIDDIEKLKGCILHEIAHILNGSRPEHDETFKKICDEIGCVYDEPTFTEIEIKNQK